MPLLRPSKDIEEYDLILVFSPLVQTQSLRMKLGKVGAAIVDTVYLGSPVYQMLFTPRSCYGYNFSDSARQFAGWYGNDYSTVFTKVNGSLALDDRHECKWFLRQVVKRHRPYLLRLCSHF